MAQAAANKGQISILDEDVGGSGTYGTTPATGTPTKIRITSEDVGPTAEFVTSDEIESSLMVTDNIRVDVGAAGGYQAELAYGAHDLPMQYLMNSAAWSTEVTTTWDSGTTITSSYTASKNQLVLTGTVTAWTNAAALGSGVAVGGVVNIAGFTGAAMNGFFRITSVSGATLTLAGITQFTAEAPDGGDVTIKLLANLTNGTTFNAFSYERNYTGLTNKFADYTGMVMTGMEVSLPLKGKAGISFTMIGKDEVNPSPTSEMGDVTAAYPAGDATGTNKVFSITADVKGMMVALDAVATQRFVSATMRWAKGDQAIGAAGELGAIDVVQGGFVVTGDLELYFENETFYDQARANTEIPLDWIIQDAAGNAYFLSFPRCVLTEASRSLPGKDQPVIARYTWAASKHGTQAIMSRIARKAA